MSRRTARAVGRAGEHPALCSLLDGASRAILHFEIRESVKEEEVERILLRAREKYPDAKRRIIRGNGPQRVARDFKNFIRGRG